MKNALIIFAKNPILGEVKTRLAKDLGDEAALKIYKDFMKLIQNECLSVKADLHLFYGSVIESEDLWSHEIITKHIQDQHNDLGKRIKAAFHKIKKLGYEKISIIGIDCPYLTSEIINTSYDQLVDNDAVIGPAKDGGFYLLGVKDLSFLDFTNIKWSSDSVLHCYESNLELKQAKLSQLEILEDIDEINSYKSYIFHLNSMNSNIL